MWSTIGSAGAAFALVVYAASIASTHRQRTNLRWRILQLADDIIEIAAEIERDLAGMHPATVSGILAPAEQLAGRSKAVLDRRNRMLLFTLKRLERGEAHLHQAHAEIVQLRYRADAALASRRRTKAGELSSS